MKNFEETDIINYKLTFDYEKIHLKTFSNKNIIELAREEEYFNRIYKDILKSNYILYMHKNFTSYFVKRDSINKLWKRNDLIQYEGIFYTIEEPPEDRIIKDQSLKLLIFFSPMPPSELYNSASVSDRHFVKIFPKIHNYVIKNVVIMRIMDLNLSHGSHYVNSISYPMMEEHIHGAIKVVKEKYSISDEDVVLYGVSKGGTGALLHSIIGDYKSLTVDPIISLEEYNEEFDDLHFLKGFREVNLIKRINNVNLVTNNRRKKIVIVCPTVKFNYQIAKQLNGSNIELHEVMDKNIKSHPEIAKNVVPEILMFMNMLLLDKT